MFQSPPTSNPPGQRHQRHHRATNSPEHHTSFTALLRDVAGWWYKIPIYGDMVIFYNILYYIKPYIPISP